MIIVKLNGGLGNQMFQYATARKLSLNLKTSLVFDTTEFENYKLRTYRLAHFNFAEHIASKNELVLFGVKQEENLVKKYYYKILRKLLQPIVIHERQFNFDEDVFIKAKKNTYLDGYWQSEKYFVDIKNILLDDFKIKSPLVNKNLEFAEHIRSVNSVSLHIRRGDYVTVKETSEVHGLCGLDYYARAIEYISEKVKNPIVFIFSDDMKWSKENLILPGESYHVNCNDAYSDYQDLRLMSLCKHNIIANSSFSWWGAWLNTNESKIVIAPEKWFANADRDYSDVIPESWIRR